MFKQFPKGKITKSYYFLLFILVIMLVWGNEAIATSSPSLGQRLEALEQNSQAVKVALDTIWVVFASTLVFFMNAGFAMLETGFCRQKNAVNMLSKNLIVFALATVAFWAIGFGIMFGNGNGFFGTHGFFLSGADNSPATGDAYKGVFKALNWTGIPLETKFLFQLVFAGTTATIVSGAVAERIKFGGFILFSLLLVSFAYPMTGHWVWGKGWLASLHFWDFAGSTLVHSVGGWCGLMGSLLLGPRLGRYVQEDISATRQFSYFLTVTSVSGKTIRALPAHNLSIATLGAMILWLGWFGFNPGSVMAANPSAISHILLTTNLAAAAGSITATITTWLYFGKPDLSFIINGVLAGLVAITASCAYVGLAHATLIGTVAGIIVVVSSVLLEQHEIDDPVGAIAVHLACGIWGTLAVGLFSVGPNVYPWYNQKLGPAPGLFLGGGFNQLGVQLLGIIAVAVFTIIFSFSAWFLINRFIGLRVSPEEEMEGLDLSEHGMSAYEIDGNYEL